MCLSVLPNVSFISTQKEHLSFPLEKKSFRYSRKVLCVYVCVCACLADSAADPAPMSEIDRACDQGHHAAAMAGEMDHITPPSSLLPG